MVIQNPLSWDSFNIKTYANTDGWGNKLVTIFARYLDNFFMTIEFSLICQIRIFRLLTKSATETIYRSPGLAKIAPWWLAAGTVYRLKYCMTHRRTAPPTFTPSTAGPLAFRPGCADMGDNLHIA
jgi:hypothetical protein